MTTDPPAYSLSIGEILDTLVKAWDSRDMNRVSRYSEIYRRRTGEVATVGLLDQHKQLRMEDVQNA